MNTCDYLVVRRMHRLNRSAGSLTWQTAVSNQTRQPAKVSVHNVRERYRSPWSFRLNTTGVVVGGHPDRSRLPGHWSLSV